MEHNDRLLNDEELEEYNHPWRLDRGSDYFDDYNPKEVAKAQRNLTYPIAFEAGEKKERERIARSIEGALPTITRFAARSYLVEIVQALKEK